MKKILLALFPSLLLSCMWIDGTTIDGKYNNHASIFEVKMLKSDIYRKTSETKLKKIIEDKNDKKRTMDEQEEHDAIVLLLQGKYKKSINKLLELDKKYKNKYSIASNLGTAYELNGNNIEALTWITKGIQRDANSHYGTEWLHQLILKTKIKLQKSPNFLKTNRIISLPNKFNKDTNISIETQIYSVSEIERALTYQVRERIIFVKPKDVIVADLFYTLARISAQTSSLEKGLAYLELAELYGFSQKELLEEKKEFYLNIKDNPSFYYYFNSIFNTQNMMNIPALLVFIAIFGIIYILLKRAIFFLYKKLFK